MPFSCLLFALSLGTTILQSKFFLPKKENDSDSSQKRVPSPLDQPQHARPQSFWHQAIPSYSRTGHTMVSFEFGHRANTSSWCILTLSPAPPASALNNRDSPPHAQLVDYSSIQSSLGQSCKSSAIDQTCPKERHRKFLHHSITIILDALAPKEKPLSHSSSTASNRRSANVKQILLPRGEIREKP